MNQPYNVRRIVHVIHACLDYHAVREKYMNVFGALVFAEGYHPEADRDMNLFYVGDFMVEPMAPRGTTDPKHPMASIYKGYLDRFGEGWHSYEVAVDGLPEVLEDLKGKGMRISPGVPFTHPLDSFGMSIEMIPGEGGMPNDPVRYTGFDLKNWFRGNHPLTLEGLAAMVHIVPNVPAARDYMVNVWGAKAISEDTVTTPEPMDRADVELAGVRFVLVKPTGESGPVSETMARRKLGIYSLAWKVGSLEQAKAHLAKNDVRAEEGTSVMGGICLHPDDMFGARHELIEA